MINKMLMATGVLFATAGSAAAQSYEAEIDCGDVDSEPGERVPFTIRLEEQGHVDHSIDLRVRVTRAGAARTIFERTISLLSNEDRDLDRFFRLGTMAPTGSYKLRLKADDGTLVVRDSCSFEVI